MSEFVNECRREWKRLRVPDAVANEMAADLAADLEEAEAEGVSAEEVLGTSAFDPRAFAAAWAAERGVVPPAPVAAAARKRSFLPAAVVAVLAIAALVAGAALLSTQGSARVAVAPIVKPHLVLVPRVGALPSKLPRFEIRKAPAPFGVVTDGGDSALRAVGWLLLFVGLAGVVLATYWYLRDGSPRWPRPPTLAPR